MNENREPRRTNGHVLIEHELQQGHRNKDLVHIHKNGQFYCTFWVPEEKAHETVKQLKDNYLDDGSTVEITQRSLG